MYRKGGVELDVKLQVQVHNVEAQHEIEAALIEQSCVSFLGEPQPQASVGKSDFVHYMSSFIFVLENHKNIARQRFGLNTKSSLSALRRRRAEARQRTPIRWLGLFRQD